MAEKQHYLDVYLAAILPTLGLDHETYGPYITGADDEDDLDEIIEVRLMFGLRSIRIHAANNQEIM
jgi:hypothetical protein